MTNQPLLARHPASRWVRRVLQRELWRQLAASAVASGFTSGLLALASAIGGTPPATNLVWMVVFAGSYGSLYLLLSSLAFRRPPGGSLQRETAVATERNIVLRLVVDLGPQVWAIFIVALGVISVVLLSTQENRHDGWTILFCIVGVVGSWILLVSVYTMEYLRLWAREDSLHFPGDDPRSFDDFVYLSVQLSTTFSSSDVELITTAARRLATTHSIVAFTYSTVVVAIFASLLLSIR